MHLKNSPSTFPCFALLFTSLIDSQSIPSGDFLWSFLSSTVGYIYHISMPAFRASSYNPYSLGAEWHVFRPLSPSIL